MIPVRFHDAARSELAEEVLYYAEIECRLGERLFEAVQRAVPVGMRSKCGVRAADVCGNLPQLDTLSMNSNSVRVSAELFEQARTQGELLSRSAAQQIEHWARIGAALEAAGLSVPAATGLIDSGGALSEKELWRDKRARQARDREAVKAGFISGEQLRWFRNGVAKRVKLVGSPL